MRGSFIPLAVFVEKYSLIIRLLAVGNSMEGAIIHTAEGSFCSPSCAGLDTSLENRE